MVGRDARTLMSNYHQFLLTDGDGSRLAELRLPADDGLVTGESGWISVRTGAYAAPVELLIENCESEPALPGLDWEDVIELSVRCSQRIVVGALFEAPSVTAVSSSGWYRLRIFARGRDAGEERGEVGSRATVIEHYLIQTWPAPPVDGVTVRATSLQPVDHTAGRVHLAAARDAAARINRDLDSERSRPLSGATGTATAQWTFPASPRKLFRYVALPNLWTSATTAGTSKPEVGAQYWMWNNDYRDIWDGIPTSNRGHLEATIVQITAPRSVVSTWQWLNSRHYGEGQPILTRPTTVTMQLRPDGGDTQTTTVHVQHDDLPIEWVDDMTAIWLCKLEAGRDVYPIHR